VKASAATSRRQATREAIMDSALDLFAQRGYESVRVEDVARAAGISRATFYNHFSEREEILGALIERLLSVDGENPEPDADTPPLERIEDVAAAAAGTMLKQPELARFIYGLPVRHEALLKPESAATPAVFRTIHHLLEEAESRGELRADMSVDLMCVHVHNALEAGMRAWAEGVAPDAAERVRALVRLALYGVVARRPE
jgi:AcrR family transcriptional regulator